MVTTFKDRITERYKILFSMCITDIATLPLPPPYSINYYTNVAKVYFMITVGAAESRYVPAAQHLRATDTIVDGPS